MKKILSMLMILSLFLSMLALPAAATEADPEIMMAMQGEIIPKNVAEVLGELFVQSNVNSGMETAWNSATVSSETIMLYDEKGLPCAYSVALETDGKTAGYIVISAYPDMENYILEYADISEPLYDAFEEEETEAIVYTGNLQYYQQTEDDVLLDLQGEEAEPKDIFNIFDEIRDENAIQEARISAQNAYAASTPPFALFVAGGKDSFGTIVDPLAYIAAQYGNAADMVAYEWKSLEQYTNHRRTNSFSTIAPTGNCGPTAITNIVEIVGNMRNVSTIKNQHVNSIYATVEQIGLDNGWFKTSTAAGSEGRYITAVLSHYGVRMRSTEIYGPSYEKMKFTRTSRFFFH